MFISDCLERGWHAASHNDRQETPAGSSIVLLESVQLFVEVYASLKVRNAL
jgi:hypothetical protein